MRRSDSDAFPGAVFAVDTYPDDRPRLYSWLEVPRGLREQLPSTTYYDKLIYLPTGSYRHPIRLVQVAGYTVEAHETGDGGAIIGILEPKT